MENVLRLAGPATEFPILFTIQKLAGKVGDVGAATSSRWVTAILCSFITLPATQARAQTRQETVDFLFNGAVVQAGMGDKGLLAIFGRELINENDCVLTLRGSSKSIVIDFNKLVMSSAELDGSQITITGDNGAVQLVEGSNRTSSNAVKIILALGPQDSLTRYINALRYFASNFCPGKRSAF